MSNHQAAYAVPFWIDRRDAPRIYHLFNISDETVKDVRATMLGSGLLLPVSATCLIPGAELSLAVLGSDLSRDSVVVVSWFGPGGDEYLWRFSF